MNINHLNYTSSLYKYSVLYLTEKSGCLH